MFAENLFWMNLNYKQVDCEFVKALEELMLKGQLRQLELLCFVSYFQQYWEHTKQHYFERIDYFLDF